MKNIETKKYSLNDKGARAHHTGKHVKHHPAETEASNKAKRHHRTLIACTHATIPEAKCPRGWKLEPQTQ